MQKTKESLQSHQDKDKNYQAKLQQQDISSKNGKQQDMQKEIKGDNVNDNYDVEFEALKEEDSKYDFIKRFRKKANVVFVLGGPGSGKGTQCQKVIGEFGSNFVHLSCGDLLRTETRMNTRMGNFIENLLKQGQLVPSQILVRLLKKNMYEMTVDKRGKCVFLIDGFPRNIENITVWEELMKKDAFVNYTYYFDCDEATMEERLLKRAQTSSRSDDNLETIRRRFSVFKAETEKLINDTAMEGKMGFVYRLDARRSVNSVFKEVKDQIRMTKLDDFSDDIFWQDIVDGKYGRVINQEDVIPYHINDENGNPPINPIKHDDDDKINDTLKA